MRLAALAPLVLAIGVVAFAVNFIGATGGHCDDSCSADFPYWLYVASGWTAVAALGLLLLLGVVALVRRARG